jgi:hypothetical protein
MLSWNKDSQKETSCHCTIKLFIKFVKVYFNEILACLHYIPKKINFEYILVS